MKNVDILPSYGPKWPSKYQLFHIWASVFETTEFFVAIKKLTFTFKIKSGGTYSVYKHVIMGVRPLNLMTYEWSWCQLLLYLKRIYNLTDLYGKILGALAFWMRDTFEKSDLRYGCFNAFLYIKLIFWEILSYKLQRKCTIMLCTRKIGATMWGRKYTIHYAI